MSGLERECVISSCKKTDAAQEILANASKLIIMCWNHH